MHPPGFSRSYFGARRGTGLGPGAMEGQLSELDPATRSVIMKMQPKLREELLQGMQEEGPEGYRYFIRNYYKQLTKVKGAE